MEAVQMEETKEKLRVVDKKYSEPLIKNQASTKILAEIFKVETEKMCRIIYIFSKITL